MTFPTSTYPIQTKEITDKTGVWRRRGQRRGARALATGALATGALLAVLLATLAGCGVALGPIRIGDVGRGATAPSGPTRYAFSLAVIGASDAFGVGTDDPDYQNWPTRLALELPQPTHLINLGVPGATLALAQRAEAPVALDAHPRAIVIWMVVNDYIRNVSLADYTATLRATLATIRQHDPQTRVFVGDMPDLRYVPYFYGRDPFALYADVQAWNTAIAQACADNGATLLDIGAAWGNLAYSQQYISQDGLHPSTEGAQALADYFSRVIHETMGLGDHDAK